MATNTIEYPPPISSDEVIAYLAENLSLENYVTIMTIVCHPIFTRLRDIKQLGPLSYYFKSGSHSRYEHSFGVAYLGLEFLERLLSSNKSIQLSERAKTMFTIACLCHDLGHGPFSHTFEFAMKFHNKDVFDHERNGIELLKKIVSETRLGLTVEEIGIIARMIKGDPLQNSDEYPPFMFEILANSIYGVDVDKMDYLMRDTKELRLEEEYEFISSIVRNIIESSYLNADLEICYDNAAKDVIELMKYRSKMFNQYYNCDKAAGHNALAICAISEVIDVPGVHLLTDSEVLGLISERCGYGDPSNSNDPFLMFDRHKKYAEVMKYLKDLNIGKKNWKQIQKVEVLD